MKRRVRGWWGARSRRFRFATLGLVFGGLLSLVALLGVAYAATRIPLPDRINNGQSTVLLYSDGSEMVQAGGVNRTNIRLDQVPLPVRHAVLAAEDRHYYSEPGISIPGIGRALWTDITGGKISQGGSTITQQYAKNAYLTQQRTFTRKIREVFLAVKLDQTYSKDQILEYYLNSIYFGRSAFGIEAASKAYFGVTVSKLSPEQGAVLAGLIRSPNNLDPARHPKAAKTRWNQVLDAMRKSGWLTPAERAAAKYPPVRGLDSEGGSGAKIVRPDLAYIRLQVEQELIANGVNESRLQLGGLRVQTTIDRKAQEAAERAIETITKGAPGKLQEGLVAIDPSSGEIRASYGGKQLGRTTVPGALAATAPDFLDNVFDSKAEVGSSFKPIDLAAALDKGIALTSTYDGHSPKVVPGTDYTASNPLHNFKQNGQDEQFGQIDLPTALANSVNTVFVPLAMDAGLQHVVDIAHRLGIPDSGPRRVQLTQTASVALGIDAMQPIDMATVYATFANRGTWNKPHLVKGATDNHGHEVYKAPKVSPLPAVSKDVAADATTAMEAVVQRGTATAGQLDGGRPAAGKTGTTGDNKSAWFNGFTPQLSASVVLFNDDNAPLRNLLGFQEVTGGTIPVKIWKAFMDAALQGQPVLQFPAAANVGAPATPSADATPTDQPSPSDTPSAQPSSAAPSDSGGLPTIVPQSSSAQPTQQPTQPPSSAPPPSQQPTAQAPNNGAGGATPQPNKT